MCTVTIVRFNEWPERGAADEAHAGSVLRLVCNRDERLSRHPALRPIARRLGDRGAILPLDEEGGGTWIAATSAGLAMALLNVKDGTAAYVEERFRGPTRHTLREVPEDPQKERAMSAFLQTKYTRIDDDGKWISTLYQDKGFRRC